MSTDLATTSRPFCYRCGKPAVMCVCASVPSLRNRTGLQILQHSAERRHPLGTARLLRLGLQNVDLHVLFSNHADGACEEVALPPRSGLLYPSPDAIDLAGLPEDEAPEHLVVIDGTWAQAHRVYRDNAWIRALPHYRIHPDTPSRYRIRREPRFECLSTLEAVAESIRILEPGLAGLDDLIAAFERMIDDQIRATEQSQHKGRGAAHAPRPRAAPRATFDHPDRVIVAYAEPMQAPISDEGARDLLQLTAVHLATGATFDALVRHPAPPDRFHLGQLGLSVEDFADASPLEEVRAAFAAFCGDAPVLSTWHLCTHRILGQLAVADAGPVLLKGAWANRTRTRVPALDDLVRRLGLETFPVAVRGRASAQLSWAVAMAGHLAALDRAAGEEPR